MKIRYSDLSNSNRLLLLAPVLVLVMVGSQSCEKIRSKQTTVDVYVETGSLGIPMIGDYYVYLKEYSTDASGLSIATIATEKVDSDGHCYFDFMARKNDGYRYEVEFAYPGEGTWSVGIGNDDTGYQEKSFASVTKGEEQEIELVVEPAGRLIMSAQNKDPLADDENHYMLAQWRHRNYSYSKELDGGGDGPETSRKMWIGEYIMYYSLVSNGSTTEVYVDTFTLAQNEKLFVPIAHRP